MTQAKIGLITLATIDHRGRRLDPPQVTAEVTLTIEVPIPYADITSPAKVVQEYIRGLGAQFSFVTVEEPDDLTIRP